MRMLSVRWSSPLLGLVVVGLFVQAADNSAVEERLRKDITMLASGEFEGRGVLTEGINKAADYIANEFKKAGLKPGGKDGTYFQPFTMAGAKLGEPNRLILVNPKGEEIAQKLGEHFQVWGISHSGNVKGEIVFAGFGITSGKDDAYDDFQDVDVAGKLVVILRDAPNLKSLPYEKGKRREHLALTNKIQNALKNGAVGVLFVNDRDFAKTGDDLTEFDFTCTMRSPNVIPAIHIRRDVADAMIHSSLGKRLDDLEQEIHRDLKPKSAVLKGWTARLEVNVKRGQVIEVKNVIGVREGEGPLAKETVVIGGHYDHIGYGGSTSLAGPGLRKKVIHYGADDNASGTTAVIELARRFGDPHGPAPDGKGRRRLVFIAFSAEESGLLGSVHYCKEPIFPLESMAAMVNLDMVGRMRKDPDGWAALLSMAAPAPQTDFPVLPLAHALKPPQPNFLDSKDDLTVYGVATAKEFDPLLDALNRKHDFRLRKMPGGIGPSDHSSFCEKQVPVFFFITGGHNDAHKPTDTADKINVVGMRRVADLVTELVVHLAETPDRPRFVQSKAVPARLPEGRIPRLGIRPGDSEGQEGILVESVVENGPGAKAGMRANDRIIGVGDKPVKDIQSYMAALGGHPAGTPVEIRVLRDGQKLILTVHPE